MSRSLTRAALLLAALLTPGLASATNYAFIRCGTVPGDAPPPPSAAAPDETPAGLVVLDVTHDAARSRLDVVVTGLTWDEPFWTAEGASSEAPSSAYTVTIHDDAGATLTAVGWLVAAVADGDSATLTFALAAPQTTSR